MALPGRVRVTGRAFEVVVPWAAVGGRKPADVSVFLDWSSGAGGVAADATIRSEFRPD